MHSFSAPRSARAFQLDWVRGTFAFVALFAATAMGQSTVALPTVDAAPDVERVVVSLQPCRLADTRLSSGYSPVDALTMQIPARGVCGIPSNATSLALTLTVDAPQTAGFLTAWPADQARPLVSELSTSPPAKFVQTARSRELIPPARSASSPPPRPKWSSTSSVRLSQRVPAQPADSWRVHPHGCSIHAAAPSCLRAAPRPCQCRPACQAMPLLCVERHDHGILGPRLRHRVSCRRQYARPRRFSTSIRPTRPVRPQASSRCRAVAWSCTVRRRAHRRRSPRLLHRPIGWLRHRWTVHGI